MDGKIANRWQNDVANKLPGETLIEEDTVVLAEMVVERGRSSAKALKQYRAIDIHELNTSAAQQRRSTGPQQRKFLCRRPWLCPLRRGLGPR